MVGLSECKRIGWIWLHTAVPFTHNHKHNHVQTQRGTDSGKHWQYNDTDSNSNTDSHSHSHRSHSHCHSTDEHSAADSNLTLLAAQYPGRGHVISLIAQYCGRLCGWKPSWICPEPHKLASNLKMYKRLCYYPSQSLMDDEHNAQNRRFMRAYNQHNVLADCLVVSTRRHGFWLGNILTGTWYPLGIEAPHLKNLHIAMARGSMSMELFPRSDRLYFSGGLVCSMPISTVVELDIDAMKLGILSEMRHPRAYLAMAFFPDSLVFVGGTNCWDKVYSGVESYDLLERKWKRLQRLNHARYGHHALTINERYIFVTGGCSRFYSVMNCEVYDRKADAWTEYSSMLAPAHKCHALKFKEDIFVVGAKSRMVQIFNFEKKVWRMGQRLNATTSVRGCKLATIDYKLVAMDRDDISLYQIYDERTDRWYSSGIRAQPLMSLYPPPFMHSEEVTDWFHLGRKYW